MREATGSGSSLSISDLTETDPVPVTPSWPSAPSQRRPSARMRAGLAQRRLQPTTRPERDLRPFLIRKPTTRPERDLRPFDEQNERVFSLLWIGGAVRQVKRRTEDAKVQA